MSTTKAYLSVRGIDVDITYKDIKNLHIGVYPPFGRVRVAAPYQLNDDQVRLAVVQRLSWIKQQRAQLRSAERQTEREMVSGESHYVWGLRRRLKVITRPGRGHVEIDHDRMLLYVPEYFSTDQRRDVLDRWYREQLRGVMFDLVGKWESRLGLSVGKWSIRRMKTKWGSCNPKTGHIWFNVELAKKPRECVEYIVVHEMMHYLERGHGDRFVHLMDEYMPDWRTRRDELNQAPLRHEDWDRV